MEEKIMKVLLVILCIITLFFYFFSDVTYNGLTAHGITRIILAMIAGAILTILFGLPLLGILFMLGF